MRYYSFISITNIWPGYYFIEGIAKTLTGVISAITAVMIWKLIPRALALPSNTDLLLKNRELKLMEKKLQETNQFLEQRVDERTQQLAKMAATDSLSGLGNRGEVMKHLGIELERARRYNKPMCVLMIDLDNFKLINDTCGHQAGDEVIIDSAIILKDLCRTSDKVGRYGGEEFVIVLPETDTEAATILAERIREDMPQRCVYSLDGKEITYTCSIGVAELKDNLDQHTLLQVADKALYKAKFDGRNRVVS